MTSRRKRIAFLTNDLTSDYQRRVAAAIKHVARRRGVNLVIAVGRELNHPDLHDRAQNIAFEWVGQENVDGAILLSGSLCNWTGLPGLQDLITKLRVPTCSIGIPVPGVPSILLDNVVGVQTAVEHLIREHGRRRIVFIGGPQNNAEAQARLQGYAQGLAQAGLPYDESLVAHGLFTLQSGVAAIDEVLERGVEFDGVVAANDYMAIAAIDVLRARGLSVPEQVPVIGFDDSPLARYAARSLSSVGQPIDLIADCSVDRVLRLIDDEPGPLHSVLEVKLVLRESCGCGYLNQALPAPAAARAEPFSAYLRAHRDVLIAALNRSKGTAREHWPRWAPVLLGALERELDGHPGEFLLRLEELTEQATSNQIPLDELGRAIAHLRSVAEKEGYSGGQHLELERLWMKAVTLLAAASSRAEGRAALNLLTTSLTLRRTTQKLSVALEPGVLSTQMAQQLPKLDVHTSCVALTDPQDPSLIRPIVAFRRGEHIDVGNAAYPLRQIFPEGFLPESEVWSVSLMALAYERQLLGLAVFDGEADPYIIDALRAQVAGSIKLAAMHARVVEETAHRERLAHQQLRVEMDIARRIQTALGPKDLGVPRLEITAAMHPADQVGGDYYDVFPMPDGCWIGIGDVTGHGLLSGMVMLMIQSMVSTLVHTRGSASPAELVTALNRVLMPNIRQRMGQEEHATFMLLRYFDDGRVAYAGAHEEVVVYRAAERRCEVLPMSGIWVGIIEDIGDSTQNYHCQLQPGDLLLLYTDGLIEARNAQKEQFGLHRVQELLATVSGAPVEEIRDRLINAARAWAPVQQDDITCVVSRYLP